MKWITIVLYILGGLLVIGGVYAGFVYLPQGQQVAQVSEPTQEPLYKKILQNGTTSCPTCPICAQGETKTIEKIVYKDNPEQTKIIQELQNQINTYKTVIESYKTEVANATEVCKGYMEKIANNCSTVLSSMVNDCKSILTDSYNKCESVINSYDSALSLAKSACQSLSLPYIPTYIPPQYNSYTTCRPSYSGSGNRIDSIICY